MQLIDLNTKSKNLNLSFYQFLMLIAHNLGFNWCFWSFKALVHRILVEFSVIITIIFLILLMTSSWSSISQSTFIILTYSWKVFNMSQCQYLHGRFSVTPFVDTYSDAFSEILRKNFPPKHLPFAILQDKNKAMALIMEKVQRKKKVLNLSYLHLLSLK